MSAGSARLNHTLKTLREHLEIVKEQWADNVARDFEKNHLAPLESQATVAIRGMEKIAEVLSRVRHDCA